LPQYIISPPALGNVREHAASIVRASPMLLSDEKICSICKDKKCLVCAFRSGSVLPQKIFPLLYKPNSTEKKYLAPQAASG
jgi:hypothetical protein